jgi:hypothetical protein
MYRHRVRTKEPSPLTEDERALLDALLSHHDFPGVMELREQAQHVLAKRGCQCGCGTIDFVPDATPVLRSEAANPAPVEGVVKNADDEEVGGLILFIKDGMLLSLEIYSYAPRTSATSSAGSGDLAGIGTPGRTELRDTHRHAPSAACASVLRGDIGCGRSSSTPVGCCPISDIMTKRTLPIASDESIALGPRARGCSPAPSQGDTSTATPS